MRLEYFNVGDICYTDELNALITIFLNSNEIYENIKMTEDGYVGDFGTYVTHFGELIVDQDNNPILDENGDYQYMDRVDYLNEGIVIKNYLIVDEDGNPILDEDGNYQYEDMTGYILIDIDSEFVCKYVIEFGGKLWASSNNKIAIDLSECKYDEEENPNGYLADDFIKNEFKINIDYETPFIGFLNGDDGIISTTTELYDKIQTSYNETIKLTGVYNFENDRYEIIHDSTNIININSNINIETDHDVYIVNKNNTNNKVFKVDTEGILTLNNIIFQDIKHNSSNDVVNGSVIENRGELNINKCQFVNCQTNGYGTVYSFGNLNATDCKFINCSSTYGGGIFTWKDEEFYNDS